MRTIALRFSNNFAPEEGTISAHEIVIAEKGFVWYGKLGSRISSKANGMLKLYSEETLHGSFIALADVYSLIPLSDISALFIMDYHGIGYYTKGEHKQLKDATGAFDEKTNLLARHLMWQHVDLKNKCIARRYRRIEYPKRIGHLYMQGDLIWKQRNKLTDGTPLYCDWEYIDRVHKGITATGLGAFGFSANFEWRGAPAEIAEKMINNNAIDFCDAANSLSGTVEGHIMIRAAYVIEGKLKYKRLFEETQNFEGKEWVMGIFSPFPFTSTEDLFDKNWCIVMLKIDNLQISEEMFGLISDKVRVYGEFVGLSANTEYGESADFFIRARIAASIKAD